MDDPPPLSSSGLRVERESLPATLRLYVREMYEETIPALAHPMRFPVSASTTPCLNVSVAGEQWVEIGTGFWIPSVVVAGGQPEAYAVRVHGAQSGFYVVFEPVGPLALLGMRRFWRGATAPPAFADTVRPSLASAAEAYSQTMLAAPDFAARVRLTETFLIDAYVSAPAADLADAVFLQAAVNAVETSAGAVRVATLAQSLGVSPSTLRRRFRVLGMPVKRFAEIVRFRQAHAYLQATPGARFAEAAHRFSFADQAHFARDYRRFSGTPPTRWLPAARIVDRRMGIEGRYESETDAA